MKTTHVYKPFTFFAITFLLTWSTWFTAAFFAHRGGDEAMEVLLLLAGLLGPLVATLFMVFGARDKWLIQDFRSKLTNGQLIQPIFLPFIVLLLPAVMVLSIVLSLPFGQSWEQFTLATQFRIMDGQPLLSLVIPFLAPMLEELGWSGYGIDSLKGRSNLMKSSLSFGLIWAAWHLPLFFVKGYYHANLLEANWIYAVNFFISVIPLTIITNWLYFKNHRSIIVAILFHVVVVISSEMFLVTNFTKCIVTVVLAILSIVLVVLDKQFFFAPFRSQV